MDALMNVRTERLWFALLSALAACIALVPAPSPPVSGALTLSLLVAVAWFSAESPFGDGRRAAAAITATLLAIFTFVATRVLALMAPSTLAAVLATLLQTGLLGMLAVVAGLALHGAAHAWPARRWRAFAVACVALVPVAIAWRGFVANEWFQAPPFALAAVAAAVFAMLAEPWFARSAQRRHAHVRDFAHTSRLAVVGELTASIAHEINQPLGAILSNVDAAEMLLERIDAEDAPLSLDELRLILSDIRRDGLRASGVIRHVRTLAGSRELSFDRVDANVLAIDTVKLLDGDMRRRRIAVDIAPAVEPAILHGDPGYLEQVLINLLLNAMDAVEAQSAHASSAAMPAIVLGIARTAQGAIEFRVIDAGQGIPEERLTKLFHSFYSSKPHGMGLGLSIARSIVEAHGGWIRAENNRGPGATFRVTFPPYAEHGA